MSDREISYEHIIRDVTPEKFKERLNELMDMADRFIFDSGYEGSVECNERIMTAVLLDYFADIYRLKYFHDITRVRSEKIAAYTIAWLVRRKPLQFVKYNHEEKDIYVNERFAAQLFLNECLKGGEKHFVSSENKIKLDEYLELLLYYLKYRECNPQVIELAIESYKMGMLTE